MGYLGPRKNGADIGLKTRSLLRAIEPHVAKLNAARAKYGLRAELSCVVFIESETPSIHFDWMSMSVLAQLEAEIDIDVYVLPADLMS